MRRLIDLFVIIFCLSGCTPSELDRGDYKEWWVQHRNAFSIKKDIGEVRYEISLIPSTVSGLGRNTLEVTNGGNTLEYLQVEVKVRLLNGQSVLYDQVFSEEEFVDRMNSISQNLGSSHFVIGGEKLACLDAIYQPTTGITPYASWFLTFEHLKFPVKGVDAVLTMSDPLGEYGIIKIPFSNLFIPSLKDETKKV